MPSRRERQAAERAAQAEATLAATEQKSRHFANAARGDLRHFARPFPNRLSGLPVPPVIGPGR